MQSLPLKGDTPLLGSLLGYWELPVGGWTLKHELELQKRSIQEAENYLINNFIRTANTPFENNVPWKAQKDKR